MDIVTFVKQNGHIIGAIIAGTCALTAAFIRRDRRWDKSEAVPVFGLLFGPLLSILLGSACLAGEYFAYNIESTGDALAADPGTILTWFGCVLIAAGLMWFPYNIYRLITWPKPAELVDPDSIPVGSTPMTKASSSQKRPRT